MKPVAPIIITGFMGCGKTETARALANRRGLALTDLDRAIFNQTGRTAAQLITQEGEQAFRAIETKMLRELLLNRGTGVIALGGGAWITDENRELISEHNGLSVWLDVPFELCWQRIATSAEVRPLGRTREDAEKLYLLRRPIYQLATIHLPVRADEPLENIVARLEAALASYHRDRNERSD
ncbi:MAG TPA: shikimate kinase [Pyrinomonadaceae bacterium]|nr:shikimate kinase [Pyrinomonadaceae bacterium]